MQKGALQFFGSVLACFGARFLGISVFSGIFTPQTNLEFIHQQYQESISTELRSTILNCLSMREQHNSKLIDYAVEVQS